MLIRFDRIHERDRQTYTQMDGHTDTAWRHRPHLHSIARQKLWTVIDYLLFFEYCNHPFRSINKKSAKFYWKWKFCSSAWNFPLHTKPSSLMTAVVPRRHRPEQIHRRATEWRSMAYDCWQSASPAEEVMVPLACFCLQTWTHTGTAYRQRYSTDSPRLSTYYRLFREQLYRSDDSTNSVSTEGWWLTVLGKF